MMAGRDRRLRPLPRRLANVFNLTGSEIVALVLLGLIVLGPEKLPDAVRKFTKTYNEFKKMATGFQGEVKQAFEEPMRELRGTADAVRKAADFDLSGIANDAKAAGAAITGKPAAPVRRDGGLNEVQQSSAKVPGPADQRTFPEFACLAFHHTPYPGIRQALPGTFSGPLVLLQARNARGGRDPKDGVAIGGPGLQQAVHAPRRQPRTFGETTPLAAFPSDKAPVLGPEPAAPVRGDHEAANQGAPDPCGDGHCGPAPAIVAEGAFIGAGPDPSQRVEDNRVDRWAAQPVNPWPMLR